MKIKNKNRSRDIRDICYFIDHVKEIKFRISLIQELGYNIGFNVATKQCKEKDIIIGKKNEIRLQITPKEKNNPLVACAIIN